MVAGSIFWTPRLLLIIIVSCLVFHKSTYSGTFLNFHSNYPNCHKKGTLINSIDKVLTLSHPIFIQKNLINVIDAFLKNCYPLSYIFTIVKNRIKYHTLNNEKKKSNPLIREKYFTIPYVKSISESFLPISTMFHCKLAFTIPNTLKSFIRRGKDKLEFLSNQNIVYKISCKNCDASYVGQTKRKLSTRLKEHQSDIRNNTGSPSVITDHRVTFDHNFKWDEAKILDNEASYGKRLVSEMIYIKRQKHGINKMQDTESLPDSYSNIIHALSPS
ncbi:hypothetical protein ALC57_02090 [Trachymyrmex cornetzi]|uniref:GIY-YIG domain-containing protein n=1 Tax=Trachymyrmex cornetzi TaxID=471704 RepID=A0A151JPB2_9HYME|nr:hypothetical protein ALC57_02090 [Trachymyrmex cornetzi]